jgi:hypothetical protein
MKFGHGMKGSETHGAIVHDLPEHTRKLVDALHEWANREYEQRGQMPAWLEVCTAAGMVRVETGRTPAAHARELEDLLREAVLHVPFETITSSLQEQYGMDRARWPLRDRINAALVLGRRSDSQ